MDFKRLRGPRFMFGVLGADKQAMNKTSSATTEAGPTAGDTGSEEEALLLAAIVLAAMEGGAIPMVALDHRLLVLWARAMFVRLDVPTLRALLAEDIGPLHVVIENELYVRADVDWTTSNADHRAGESVWIALHCRCRLPLRASKPAP